MSCVFATLYWGISMKHKLAFLNGFVKPGKKSAFMGVDAVIMIGATVASAVVFSTFAMSIAGILHSQYINIAFSVPKYVLADGTPSTLLAVFIMLREGFFEIIFMISIVIILFFIFTDATKLTHGKTKNMLFRSIGMAVLVMFMPVVWDPVAVEIEHKSLWLLNPLYSFDPANPCIPGVSETLKMITAEKDAARDAQTTWVPPTGKYLIPDTLVPILLENEKIVEDLERGGLLAFDAREGYVCSPTLRVSYIFEKAIHGVSNQMPTDTDSNWWENLGDAASATGETMMLGLFGGVTKAMMLAFLMMFSTVVMLGKNLWLMSIMALFPLFAGLAIMPYIGDFAKKLIKMIPPLLMCGIITAGVILAGSSGLQMMENQINEGEQLYGIPGFSYGMEGFAVTDPIFESQGSGAHGKEKIKDVSPKNQVDKELNRMDKGILFWFMELCFPIPL